MKVFIAALAHETNSFSPIQTNLGSFENGLLFDPCREPERDVTQVFVGYSDFARIARERDHEIVLSIAAWAQPSAPTNQRDYEALRDRILNDLRAALPVDMVLFMLHGAQMARECEDCEGDLLERTRGIVGASVPIGAELDLHCNISTRMVSNATTLVACKEYPHIDFPDRARELFDIIEDAALGRTRPVMAMQRVPMLARFHTTVDPMRGFVDRIKSLEGRNSVLSITLGHVFPWSDTPDTGSSVVVTTDNNPRRAAALADDLAREFFQYRATVYDKLLGIEPALAQPSKLGAEPGHGPVVMADVADNPGGGAPGDSTFLLRAVLARRAQNVAVAMLWDSSAVETAFAAGIGSTLPIRLGGKMSPMSGPPLDVIATVTALAQAPTQRGLDPNVRDPLGRAAALRVGNAHIVINSIRQQVFSPDCFTELAIDPLAQDLLVVKSSQHFHAQFAPLARGVIYCDAPGALNGDLAALTYTRLRRPIWPIDPLAAVGVVE